jgi:putative hemolysin
LDADSIVGLCLIAGAALLLLLTSAAQSARHPLGRHRPHPSTARGAGERGAPWLALEIARLCWLVVGLAALELVIVRHGGLSDSAAVLWAIVFFVCAALTDGIPRLVAGADPDGWRAPTAAIYTIERWLFWPPAVVVDSAARAARGILPRLRAPRPQAEEEDVAQLVEREENEGGIAPEERAMIRAVFELHETTAREIMAPRIDMAAVDTSATLQDVAAVIAARGFSRIPLYEGTIDNVVGIVYAKDVLASLARGDGADVQALARKPLYVPESKPLDELLKELRDQRLQIAIVVDEYGGTAGLVTIEDMLEEIVGEIQDEYDRELPLVERVGPDEVIVDGRIPIDEVAEIFDTDFSEGDYDTIGGFVQKQLGRIPDAGELVESAGLRFEVQTVEHRRIRTVRVMRQVALSTISGENG